MSVNLIAAVGKRGQVGRDDQLPWRRPEDLAWFRNQTMGGIVIVGRRTFVGMPELPGREVYSFSDDYAPGEMLKSLRWWQRPIWIAGGAWTWLRFAPLVDGLRLISAIDYDSDPVDDPRHVFFPFAAYGIEWGCTMIKRSSAPEVRNPLLSLPAAKKLQALPPEVRAVLAELLRELTVDARERAQTSWRRNKGPMAVYWKAVGAYANHLCRAVRP